MQCLNSQKTGTRDLLQNFSTFLFRNNINRTYPKIRNLTHPLQSETVFVLGAAVTCTSSIGHFEVEKETIIPQGNPT